MELKYDIKKEDRRLCARKNTFGIGVITFINGNSLELPFLFCTFAKQIENT